MKLSTREDIDAPIDYVFDQLSDFETFERSALRRGVDITRLDNLSEPASGMMWKIVFKMRGKEREVEAELTDFSRPNGMKAISRSASIGGNVAMDLVALSPSKTRMNLAVEIKPKTLSARLFVQSLRLAKGKLTKRFKNRVGEFASDIETGYKG